eukprot:scaffold11444_cov19-Tisochrysis_lutea.AAC.1
MSLQAVVLVLRVSHSNVTTSSQAGKTEYASVHAPSLPATMQTSNMWVMVCSCKYLSHVAIILINKVIGESVRKSKAHILEVTGSASKHESIQVHAHRVTVKSHQPKRMTAGGAASQQGGCGGAKAGQPDAPEAADGPARA